MTRTREISRLLEDHRDSFHPLFDTPLTPENTVNLDLSSENPELRNIDHTDTHALHDFIFGKIGDKSAGIGGYKENRGFYQRSVLFRDEEPRSIHLGVDVWLPAGEKVHSPLDGWVHSLKNNDNFGDYGATIILAHELEGIRFHTLYGHLNTASLKECSKGDPIQKGEAFCEVGPPEENGQWPPHLHFQVIIDMEEKEGDYPGVVKPSEKEHYLENCPDPDPFIK